MVSCLRVNFSEWTRINPSDDFLLSAAFHRQSAQQTMLESKVLPEPPGPIGWHSSPFSSLQPDTNLWCETTDTGLTHRVVYLFIPPTFAHTKLYCLVTATHGCEQFAHLLCSWTLTGNQFRDLLVVSLMLYHCTTMPTTVHHVSKAKKLSQNPTMDLHTF